MGGEAGRKTLELMGVADKYNRPASIETERQRIQSFIDSKDQLNWMIQFRGEVVGTIWVSLVGREELPAPSVHIMIGDPAARGKAVGYSSLSSVLDYLKDQGNRTVHSRHLTKNDGSTALLSTLGFRNVNGPYLDNDGLEWQNVARISGVV